MKACFAALIAAVGVAAGGGDGGANEDGRYSTWVESSAQYEYSTKVWQKPYTTTAIWSHPAETSVYTSTSISIVDSIESITVPVPYTTTLPAVVSTSISIDTSPTTEVITSTSYIYSTYTSLVTVTEVTMSATTKTELSRITLPTTVVDTSVQSIIVDNTVLHYTTIVDQETIINTITFPAPPPVTVPIPTTIPTTITATPTSALCPLGGPSTANSLGCGGRGCTVEFQQEALVHWSEYPDSEPLVTVLSFVDESASATCITTKCNTEVFNQHYRQTATNCAYPPCPTNTIDCNCNIVVGPIVLPGGSTTSVTQIGPSGWNLILGTVPTGRNIGFCLPDGGSCVTATSATLSTPLVYTGEVSSTVYNNASAPQSTAWYLPELGEYFPPDSPFGACTTALLRDNDVVAKHHKRQIAASNKLVWSAVPSNARTKRLNVTQEAVTERTTPASTSASTTPTSQPSTPVTTPSSSTSPSTEPTSTASAATSGETSSSIPIGTSTESPSSHSSHSGTVYITETVYYSMILSPGQQSVLDAYAASEEGLSTASAESSPSATSSSPQQQTDNAATSPQEPGYWLTLALMLFGLL
ncbi:uncharacterized protein MYCFIDRAFT_172747 [Pseudocercospora fijiensis CIRAD86]|uniref:Uncharacterized protein n=1 Tax=Pseudocercospora fijiensis (strain CIRAD86) TaxID=383855 RepID=M3BD48_PSEFD|nr:uncharacterized protein MYCFIDRAFT_172747 [Pseudocercospora fijiensis CIRAD86]EME87078.1 hypothetical protein MYCFIDRAFT_172747 [Pseudocercospora fijiensis CIRAD86]